ncbi:hypothetical protein DICA3_F38094 [Diutina catenulata]
MTGSSEDNDQNTHAGDPPVAEPTPSGGSPENSGANDAIGDAGDAIDIDLDQAAPIDAEPAHDNAADAVLEVEEDGHGHILSETAANAPQSPHGDPELVEDEPMSEHEHTFISEHFVQTPVKGIPPLKDVDSISTPKQIPVAQDEPEPEPEAAEAVVAQFLGVDHDTVGQLPPAVLDAIAAKSSTAAQMASETEFLQLQLENCQQQASKHTEQLAARLSAAEATVHELRDAQAARETAEAARDTAEAQLARAKQDAADAAASETRARSHHGEEVLQLQQQLDAAAATQVRQSQRLNELAKQLADAESSGFAHELAAMKATSKVGYLEQDLAWHKQELADHQKRFAEVVGQHQQQQSAAATAQARSDARVAELESANHQLTQSLADTQRRLQEQIMAAGDAERAAHRDRQAAENEVASARAVADAATRQSEQRGQRVAQLEQYADEIKHQLTTEVERLQQAVDAAETRAAAADEKRARAQEALEAQLQQESALPSLAPGSAAMAAEGKISLTELYTEYSHLKKQAAMERLQKEQAQTQLAQFVAELERRKPQLVSYQEQLALYEEALHTMTGKVEQIRLEREEAQKTGTRLRQRLAAREREAQLATKTTRDLGRQVVYLLISQHDEDGAPLSAAEKAAIDKIIAQTAVPADSDTDVLISERMVDFRNVAELQKQNQRLLEATHALSAQLDARDNDAAAVESAAIDEAKEAILALQGQLDTVQAQYAAVTVERDALRTLKPGPGSGGSDSHWRDQCQAQEKVLAELRASSKAETARLAGQVEALTKQSHAAELAATQSATAARLAEARLESSAQQVANLEAEAKQLAQEIAFWRGHGDKQEASLVEKSNEVARLESVAATLRLEHQSAASEAGHLRRQLDEMATSLERLRGDKRQLSEFVASLQSLVAERDQAHAKLTADLSATVSNYHSLQEKLQQREDRVALLAQQTDLALKAQNTKFEQVQQMSAALLDARTALAAKERELEAAKRQRGRGAASEPDGQSSEASMELAQLQEDLKQAEAQVEEFGNLAKAAERALVQSTESFDEYKKQAAAELEAATTARDEAERQRDQAQQQAEKAQTELESAAKQHQHDTHQLRMQLSEVEVKAEQYDAMARDYDDKLASVGRDLQAQQEVAQANQDKYTAELATTSAQAATIGELRAQVERLRSELDRVASEPTVAAPTEQPAKTASAEVEELHARIAELEDHNQLLLNQMEIDTSSDAPESVLAYLRRENAQLVAKADLAAADASEATLRVSKLEAELAQRQADLEFARSQLAGVSEAQGRAAESASSQLEQINILRESNVTLRHENEARAAKVAQAQKQAAAAAQQVAALQTEVEQLKTAVAEAEQSARLAQEAAERSRQSSGTQSAELERTVAEQQAKLAEYEAQLKEATSAGAAEVADKLADSESQIASLRDKLKDMTNQANTKLKSQNERIGKLNATVEELTAKTGEVEKKLAEANAELAKAQADAEQARDDAAKVNDAAKAGNEPSASADEVAQLKKQLADANAAHAKQLEEEKEKVTAQTRQQFEMKMKMLQKKLDRVEKEKAGSEPASTPDTPQPSAFGSGGFGGFGKAAPATGFQFGSSPAGTPNPFGQNQNQNQGQGQGQGQNQNQNQNQNSKKRGNQGSTQPAKKAKE